MALFTRVKTWNSGDKLFASDLNAEFNNIINNIVPNKIDSASSTLGNMQATLSPGDVGTEQPAGSLLDEVKQLRYMVKQITGGSQWYASLAGNLGTIASPTGSILPYVGASAPTNYLLCNGAAVSRTTYSNLFAVTSTSWGDGDGSTTFNVPDLRGQFLRGAMNLASITGSGTITSLIQATFVGHGLRTGMPVRVMSGSVGTLAASSTLYYAYVFDANTIGFGTSRASVFLGTPSLMGLGTGSNNGVLAQYYDPDAANRLQAWHGSASSGVGSYAMNTTALNGISLTDPGHAHLYNTWQGGTTPGTQSSQVPNNTFVSGTLSTAANTTGVTISTTDLQTSPNNAYVNYIIRI